MSKYDSFNRDVTKCKTLETNIQNLLNEKNDLAEKGKNTTKIEFILKGKIDNYKYEIGRLKEAVYHMIGDPQKYGISEREADKRADKIEKLHEQLQLIESKLQLSLTSGNGIGTLNQSSHTLGMESQDLEENLVKGEDGEYGVTRGKDNRQVLDTQKKMLKNQNQQFEQLSGIAQNMKEDGRMIGEEIDYQNQMLDNLDKGIDKTNMKMMRVDNKLKRLIAESNQ